MSLQRSPSTEPTTIFRYRLPLIVLFNALLTSAGFAFALALRFDFAPDQVFSLNRLVAPLVFLLLFRISAYSAFDLNRGYWRYVSTHEAVNILKAHALSSLLFTATIGFLHIPSFPRSVILIEFALSLLLSSGSRLMVRLFCESCLLSSLDESCQQPKRAVVIGAGDSGHLLVKNLLSYKKLLYCPVAVLDDSEYLQHSVVYGIGVFGTISALGKCLRNFAPVSVVIVAIPSLSKTKRSEIEKVCIGFGVPVKHLQTFEDIACSYINGSDSDLSIETVLEKETTIEHREEIQRVIAGKRVLITGGGGSIGSELARQILSFEPASLALIDNSEYNLYRAEKELSANSEKISIQYFLANICDRARVSQLFEKIRPEIVFHAAAYKHVPLLEDNAHAAFSNNVLGTRNILDFSQRFAAHQFVLISTDKAVEPSSIMGCSKRIAELLTTSFATATTSRKGLEGSLSTSVVRFGNVINSSGSVIPLFKEQIAQGKPITVTHPDMTRYFMSAKEAVKLVLTAGILGDQGEIYILDMGQELRIVDVARKMLLLYGRSDLPIVYTGIRAGEKLSERLLADRESVEKTRINKVSRVLHSIDVQRALVLNWISSVEQRLAELSETELREMMNQFVSSTAPYAVEEIPVRQVSAG